MTPLASSGGDQATRAPRPGTLARATSLSAGILALGGALAGPSGANAQTHPVGREAALALDYPPLVFRAPEVRVEEIGPDVPVLFLEDHSLPLVSMFVRFRGGYSLFPREMYAAATALPGLLRTGGTLSLAPDSVDTLLESLAVQVSVGSGGRSVSSSMNSLSSALDPAVTLWTEMLARPRFDSQSIEVWRGRELESVRRRRDDPRRLAYSEFNRLMYGDHPVGWEMGPDDLTPERLTSSRFRDVHRSVICRQNLVVGVTGDLTWDQARHRVEILVHALPECPAPLPPPPKPDIRREPGVFLIPRALDQSTIVMAHPTEVHLADDAEYFASRIGHSILGGSGFASRLMARLRTEEGLAYGASSLWTAPRDTEGLLGAVTQTRTQGTVDAVKALLEVMEQVRTEPPSQDEVSLAVERAVNGFVFNFQSPAQIVSRQMLYRIQDLPPDWLDVYLRGVQAVDPERVLATFQRHLRPNDMTILVLGDPSLAVELARFGPVTIWSADPPSGSPGAGPDVDGGNAEGLQRVRGGLEP